MTITDSPPTTATIRIAGLVITAPADLVMAAGWLVYANGATADHSGNGFVSRRLLRSMSEEGVHHQSSIDDAMVMHLLTRCVALGEIESLEGRRDNNKLAVAKLEAEAALNHRRAAELELEARRNA